MNLLVKVAPDVKIFIEDINSEGKQTILFIHGWPLNHKMWGQQVQYLAEIGFRCVLMDLRGFGKSDQPIKGYDYNTMASDVKGVIDALGLTNVVLVGHSLGAAIAIRYIANYGSSNISKLCLLSAAAPSYTTTENWPYGMTEDQVDELIKQIYEDRPHVMSSYRNHYFHKYISVEMGQSLDSIALEAALWSTDKVLVALRDERLFDDINKIDIPTLILHGIYDQICPFDNAEYLNEEIKNSTLIPFNQSGHGIFIEEFDKVSSSINLFIRDSLPKTPEN